MSSSPTTIPVETPANHSEFTDTSGSDTFNYENAWEILHNPKMVVNQAEMNSHLDELGVMEAQDLSLLDEEDLAKIEALLKKVAAKKFVMSLSKKGEYRFPNGDFYTGEFKNNIFNGHGMYTWANGDKYEGQYKDDKPNGHGILTSAAGIRYEGEFVNGERHGSGKELFMSGDVYEGMYEHDFPNGTGTWSWPDKHSLGGVLEKGVFKEGVLTAPNGEKYNMKLSDSGKRSECETIVYTVERSNFHAGVIQTGIQYYNSFDGKLVFVSDESTAQGTKGAGKRRLGRSGLPSSTTPLASSLPPPPLFSHSSTTTAQPTPVTVNFFAGSTTSGSASKPTVTKTGSSTTPSPVSGATRSMYCSRCGRDSHNISSCYASTHANGYSISSGGTSDRCYRCGKRGHWASECYSNC